MAQSRLALNLLLSGNKRRFEFQLCCSTKMLLLLHYKSTEIATKIPQKILKPLRALVGGSGLGLPQLHIQAYSKMQTKLIDSRTRRLPRDMKLTHQLVMSLQISSIVQQGIHQTPDITSMKLSPELCIFLTTTV